MTKQNKIVLSYEDESQEIVHVYNLSSYNSMMQAFINFLRGIGVEVPPEEDRV